MTSRPPARAPRARAARVLPTLVIGAALAAALVGCSGGGGDPASLGEAATSADGGAETTAASTQMALGNVTGRLPREQRDRIVRATRRSLDAWFDAAYLEGDNPRPGVRTAFPSFTSGAAARARDDREVMSNARLADGVDAVHVTARRARVDVLAVDRRPVGVTARFSVTMDLDRDQASTRRERVTGRVFLRVMGGEWRIFGYDADRTAL